MRGLRSKLRLLRHNIHTMCFNYFKLTEIWLNNNINDCEVGFDNFSLYKPDRNYAISNCNKGGGVAICVSNKFTFKIIDIPNITIDQLIVAVTIGKILMFIIGTCYISSNSHTSLYLIHIQTSQTVD